MMRSFNTSAFSLIALASVCAVAPAFGQQVPEYGSPQVYLNGAEAAMKRADYKSGLAFIDKGLSLYASRLESLGFGNKFGTFYYYRGVCLLGLKEYTEAIKAFQTCYEKFPSDAPPDPNVMMRMALYKAGEAKALSGDYDGAITDIMKFMETRRRTGNFPDARINIGIPSSYLAISYFKSKTPDFSKGIDALTVALKNRYKGTGCADNFIIDATIALIESALNSDKVDVALDFLKANPSALNIGDDRLAPFCAQIANVLPTVWQGVVAAQEKGDIKKLNSCNQLISFLSGLIPEKLDVVRSIKPVTDIMTQLGMENIRYEGIVYNKKFYDAAIKGYESMPVPIESYSLRNVGDVQANMGLSRVANAAYVVLEEKYPMMQERETNLFRLISTTWQLGDYERGNKYIEQFKKLFPTSVHMELINSLSIENLLKEGKFEQCLAEALKLKESFKNDTTSSIYILASYCEATSLFRLKRFADAQPLYNEFLKNYPESVYAQHCLYYLGSSYVSLRNWPEAIRVMNNYIQKYSDKHNNPLLPAAYYERAFSYAQRHEAGDDERCIADCQYIADNFKDNSLYPLALIMMGNIYSSTEKPDVPKANEIYLQAYENGLATKNNKIKSEALYSLICNYNAEDTPEGDAQAQKYYDLFWKECDTPDKANPFALKVGIEGMRLHKKGGPAFDAAADKMRQLIVREGKIDALNPTIEQAIGSYSSLYFDTMKAMGKPVTPDQAKDHFYNFPGVTNHDIGLRVLLRTGLIGVYQDLIRDAKPEEKELKATLEGAIAVFFKEMDRDFKPQDIPTYTLLKLGTYLSRSSQPLTSIPYFDEILKRNRDRVADARYNKALALGLSKEKDKVDEGIDMLRRELTAEEESNNPNREKLEEGQYYLAQFYFNKGDYDKSIELCQQYLDNRSNMKNRLRVLFIQAEAYENKGDIEKALTSYLNISEGFKGRIGWSAPATVKCMELYWKRNKPKPNTGDPRDILRSSDRHLAWKMGVDYLRVTGGAFEKMTIPERNAWREVEELTKKYGNDSQVAQEEKTMQERRAALKASGN